VRPKAIVSSAECVVISRVIPTSIARPPWGDRLVEAWIVETWSVETRIVKIWVVKI
jgi:hypothetical protein